MTHQPAISFSISSQDPFNRAGGRTSNVRQENQNVITSQILYGLVHAVRDSSRGRNALPFCRDSPLLARESHRMVLEPAGDDDSSVEWCDQHLDSSYYWFARIRHDWCILWLSHALFPRGSICSRPESDGQSRPCRDALGEEFPSYFGQIQYQIR